MVIQIDQLIFHNGLPLTFILSDNAGAEPVPLPSTALRENQGHETDRFAAAQPRRWAAFIVRLAPAIQNTMHKFFFVKHSSSYLGPRPTIRSSGPAFSGPLTLHVIP